MNTLPVGVRALIVVAPARSKSGQGELAIVLTDLALILFCVAVVRRPNQQHTVPSIPTGSPHWHAARFSRSSRPVLLQSPTRPLHSCSTKHSFGLAPLGYPPCSRFRITPPKPDGQPLSRACQRVLLPERLGECLDVALLDNLRGPSKGVA